MPGVQMMNLFYITKKVLILIVQNIYTKKYYLLIVQNIYKRYKSDDSLMIS